MVQAYLYRAAGIVLFVTLCFFKAQAQDELTIDDLYIDLSQREVTAFGMLDIEDDAIVRPASINELAVQWSTFPFGAEGSPLAVEINPYKLFAERNNLATNLANYRNHFWFQNLSIGVAGTSIDDGSGKMAASLNWTPIDCTNILLHTGRMTGIINTFLFNTTEILDDITLTHQSLYSRTFRTTLPKLYGNTTLDAPLMGLGLGVTTISHSDVAVSDEYNWVNTSATTIEATLRANSVSVPDITAHHDELIDLLWTVIRSYNNAVSAYAEADEAADEYIEEHIETAIMEFRDTRWNASVLQFSLGAQWDSPNREPKNTSLNTLPVIVSFAHPTFHGHNAARSSRGQMTWQLKNTFDAATDTNRLSIGFRHLYGNHKTRWSVEALLRNNTASNSYTATHFRATTGVELKIMDMVWVELALGTRYDNQNGWTPAGSGILKFDIHKQARFSTSGD